MSRQEGQSKKLSGDLGLFVSESHLIVDGCEFYGEPATETRNEAGIVRATNGSSVDVWNSIFQDVSSDVAAIVIEGESHLVVDGCSFSGNFSSANAYEAGIVRATSASSVDVRNSNFQDVSSDAAVIDVGGESHLMVDDCLFGGRFIFGSKNAGIVRATSASSVDVRNSNFQDVSSNGAAIDVNEESRLIVDDCSFRGSPSFGNGKKTAVVRATNASPVNGRNSWNGIPKYAYEAGIVRATNASSVVVRNSKFQYVTSYVAAIHVDGKLHLDISSVSFERVKGYQGSAVYATHGSSVRIDNSAFSGCTSSMTGTVAIESNALTLYSAFSHLYHRWKGTEYQWRQFHAEQGCRRGGRACQVSISRQRSQQLGKRYDDAAHIRQYRSSKRCKREWRCSVRLWGGSGDDTHSDPWKQGW